MWFSRRRKHEPFSPFANVTGADLLWSNVADEVDPKRVFSVPDRPPCSSLCGVREARMKPWFVYTLVVVALCVMCPALVGFLVGAGLIFVASATSQRLLGG